MSFIDPTSTPPASPARRGWLAAAAATAAAATLPFAPQIARAHVEIFGPVRPPEAAPALKLTLADGKPAQLTALLRQRVTALQLMFTTCSATCPIQGAVYAEAQERLAGGPADFRLLSISIDPLGDDPKALRHWLQKYGAEPARWQAAVPGVDEVDKLFELLRGRAAGPDRHTAQVYFFNRRAELVYRTDDMPTSAFVVRTLKEVASVA